MPTCQSHRVWELQTPGPAADSVV